MKKTFPNQNDNSNSDRSHFESAAAFSDQVVEVNSSETTRCSCSNDPVYSTMLPKSYRPVNSDL